MSTMFAWPLLYARRAPDVTDLLALARERFVRGEPVEVHAVAEALGVSRATAYRWVRSNDELVGQVIAGLHAELFAALAPNAAGRGAAGVLEVFLRGLRGVARYAPLRRFLEEDPQRALRLIASRDGPVQRLAIDLHRQLIERELGAGALPVDAHTLAYTLVRLGESFLYAEFVVGEPADLAKAVPILELLLGLPAGSPARHPRASRGLRGRRFPPSGPLE